MVVLSEITGSVSVVCHQQRASNSSRAAVLLAATTSIAFPLSISQSVLVSQNVEVRQSMADGSPNWLITSKYEYLT